MTDQTATRRFWVGLLIAAALLLVLAPLVSAATSLSGWLGTGTSFPNRALVMFGPSGTTLSPTNVHVTENGAGAGPLTVTPVSAAGAGDFGAMILIDQSPSMKGAPIAAAINGARAYAARRAGQQQLGVITFAGRPSLLLPPTTDGSTIVGALARTPSTASGANVPAAIAAGLHQLIRSHVALGAIIVVSDGVGALTSTSGPTPAQVKAAAAAARVPIITVGLRDSRATTASMQALAAASPGQFVSATPTTLSQILSEIDTTVTRGVIVRWTSHQRPGQAVNVVARVTGVAGQVAGGYQIAAVAKASPHPPKATTHPAATRPRFSFSRQLSSTPAFLGGPTPASPPVSSPATSPAVSPTSAASQPSQAAPVSFWNSNTGLVVVAGLSGLLIVCALALALHRPSKRAVRTRVGSYIPDPHEAGDYLIGVEHARQGGLSRMVEGGSWWAPFAENVEIARSPHTPMYLVKRSAIIAVVLAVVLAMISGTFLLALLPLLGWPFVLKTVIKRAAEKQRMKFRDTLPGYLQDLGSAMRVGRSFVGGLAVVVETADEPVRSEIERAVTDEQLGLPLDASLESVARRMHAPDMEQVALVAALNKRSGSNVAEALDRVAEGARERADLRREVRALTGQAKMSSWVLTALPGCLLAGMSVISPKYGRPLFHTTMGNVLLVVAALMVFAGWKVMKKITAVEA